MTAAIGMLSRLGIDSANPVTKEFDFVSSGLMTDEEFIDGNGLRGTLSHDISRVRQGIRRIHGPVVLQPNAVEMALLLPWIMDGSPTGTPTVTYPLADTCTTRYVAVDFSQGSLFTFDTVAVNRAVFRATQGGILNVELDLIGKDEAISGSFPALTIDTANGPWVFHDLVLVVDGVTMNAKDIEVSIDKHIDTERFFNSQKLSTPVAQDRTVMVSVGGIPYGDFTSSYGTGGANDPLGVAVTATFTNGNAILAMSFVKVALPRKSPNITGRVENHLQLAGQAYKSGGTLELVTTLNPGP